MTEIEKPDVIGATRRAETIRQGMISYAAALEAIGEAYENRDWVALGHKDWDTYCEKEFSERRLKLTREQREQAVLAFRGAGMSIRAIGSALGVSPGTVHGDLAGVQDRTPDTVTGADGKSYAASRPSVPDGTPKTSGLVDTSPAVESGEDHTDEEPGRADPADSSAQPEAPEGEPSGSAPAEQEESPDSPPVDEPEQREEGVPPAAPAPKPIETDEERAERENREFRTDRTLEFCRALVDLTMRLGKDPVAWFEQVYLPGVYEQRDLPQVKDCFEPESLHRLAVMLDALGEHLTQTGKTL